MLFEIVNIIKRHVISNRVLIGAPRAVYMTF